MGLFSRNKGKVGERELAHELSRIFGVSARRGVQFQGSPDSPDVVTEIPDLHIECKRTERFRLYEALDQAVDDCGATKIPVVFHRQNKKPWVAVVRLGDLPRLANVLVTIQPQPTISKGDEYVDKN
jgi:Holliday junction resolvase